MEKSQASELGKKAFHAGIIAPCMDPNMNAALSGPVGGKVAILKAWVRGWTIENINAMVVA